MAIIIDSKKLYKAFTLVEKDATLHKYLKEFDTLNIIIEDSKILLAGVNLLYDLEDDGMIPKDLKAFIKMSKSEGKKFKKFLSKLGSQPVTIDVSELAYTPLAFTEDGQELEEKEGFMYIVTETGKFGFKAKAYKEPEDTGLCNIHYRLKKLEKQTSEQQIICTMSLSDLEGIDDAAQFTSGDELRPWSKHVWISSKYGKVAATNAHYIYEHPIDIENKYISTEEGVTSGKACADEFYLAINKAEALLLAELLKYFSKNLRYKQSYREFDDSVIVKVSSEDIAIIQFGRVAFVIHWYNDETVHSMPPQVMVFRERQMESDYSAYEVVPDEFYKAIEKLEIVSDNVRIQAKEPGEGYPVLELLSVNEDNSKINVASRCKRYLPDIIDDTYANYGFNLAMLKTMVGILRKDESCEIGVLKKDKIYMLKVASRERQQPTIAVMSTKV